MQLEQAGLDPCSVDTFAAAVTDLREMMRAARESQEPGSSKINKAGTLALSVWDRLLATLKLMYQYCDQRPGPDDASDFRLVVRKWMENGPGRNKR
jgi:hypothetical protein